MASPGSKRWLTSMARMLGRLGINVMLAAVAITLFISGLFLAFEWHQFLTFFDTDLRSLVLGSALWTAVAAALFIAGRATGRRTWQTSDQPTLVAVNAFVLGLLVAAGAFTSRSPILAKDIVTEADARSRIEWLLKRLVHRRPNTMVIHDLGGQINNVRIEGPHMSFDPVSARYVNFDLDTGCGAIVQGSGWFDASDPDNLILSSYDSCER